MKSLLKLVLANLGLLGLFFSEYFLANYGEGFSPVLYSLLYFLGLYLSTALAGGAFGSLFKTDFQRFESSFIVVFWTAFWATASYIVSWPNETLRNGFFPLYVLFLMAPCLNFFFWLLLTSSTSARELREAHWREHRKERRLHPTSEATPEKEEEAAKEPEATAEQPPANPPEESPAEATAEPADTAPAAMPQG